MNKKLSKEEMLAKYGDVELSFRRYWKFTFYYDGKSPDGIQINVGVGGFAEDIYRMEVYSNETATLNELFGCWSFVRVCKNSHVLYNAWT